MLTLQEFDILNTIFKNKNIKFTQRKIKDFTNISLGKVNQTIKNLKEKKFLKENFEITDEGFLALEPYKVDNAIIMAAGMSSRFAPLSYEKPKALLNVKGEKLIEREILQLKEVGIDDITIVVGYMKEKMFYLADKFKVSIVVNEDYFRFNNPSSLMLVTEKMKNTYICSSDNYFTINPFEKYVYRSYYSCVFSKDYIDEYCVTVDKKDKITSVKIGDKNSWYMLGHVFFDKDFSKKFVEILKREYEKPTVCERLWEDLYISNIKDLCMYIRRYDENEIKEFDSLDELRLFDDKYITDSNSKIFTNICKILNCKEEEIKNIFPIKYGMTNTSFKFDIKNKSYIYRHPGYGTEKYINRKSEKYSMDIAKKLNLDNTYIYMDEDSGFKISHFIKNSKILSYDDEKNVKISLDMLRKLHKSGIKSEYTFDIFNSIKKFRLTIKDANRDDFDDINKLNEMIEKLRKFLEKENFEKCICHCDSYNQNFLLDEDENINLIDWEYSAMSDPAVDIGTFIACSKYSYEKSIEIIKYYLKENFSNKNLRHFISYVAICSYFWFLWGIIQEINGKSIGEYLYIWYTYIKMYSKKALDMYKD